MGKLICPRCGSDLLFEGEDRDGNGYWFCDKPHNWFQKFLKLIRVKKNWR